MAQTGTVCQYYLVALHKFFVHCHIFVDRIAAREHIPLRLSVAHSAIDHSPLGHLLLLVDLCQITLGQALAHRSRMSLRRFCQPVCYSIKCDGLWYAFVAVGSFGPEFDKYVWECLCLFCEEDHDPPVLFKCVKCDGPRFHHMCVSKKLKHFRDWECQWCSEYREYVFSAD